MQRGRIVDAIAHIADHMPTLLERQDDTLFLVGVDFGEDSRLFDHMPQGFVAQIVYLGAGQDLDIF